MEAAGGTIEWYVGGKSRTSYCSARSAAAWLHFVAGSRSAARVYHRTRQDQTRCWLAETPVCARAGMVGLVLISLETHGFAFHHWAAKSDRGTTYRYLSDRLCSIDLSRASPHASAAVIRTGWLYSAVQCRAGQGRHTNTNAPRLFPCDPPTTSAVPANHGAPTAARTMLWANVGRLESSRHLRIVQTPVRHRTKLTRDQFHTRRPV